MNSGLVVLIGLGVVFIGLIILIIAIVILNAILGVFESKESHTPDGAESYDSNNKELEIEHDILISVVAAAIAQKTDKDIAGLRIKSIRKV